MTWPREQALKNEFQQEIARRAHEKLHKNAVLDKAQDNIRSIEEHQTTILRDLDQVVSEKEVQKFYAQN